MPEIADTDLARWEEIVSKWDVPLPKDHVLRLIAEVRRLQATLKALGYEG